MAEKKKKTPEGEKKAKRKDSALKRFILGKTKVKPITDAIGEVQDKADADAAAIKERREIREGKRGSKKSKKKSQPK